MNLTSILPEPYKNLYSNYIQLQTKISIGDRRKIIAEMTKDVVRLILSTIQIAVAIFVFTHIPLEKRNIKKELGLHAVYHLIFPEVFPITMINANIGYFLYKFPKIDLINKIGISLSTGLMCFFGSQLYNDSSRDCINFVENKLLTPIYNRVANILA